MAIYDTAHVKNVALLGHAGSGKTTFAECAVYEAGLINRRGTVEEKSTLSDYNEFEQERGNSVYASLLHTTWKGYKINIIDNVFAYKSILYDQYKNNIELYYSFLIIELM